jgi:hypothetical protein
MRQTLARKVIDDAGGDGLTGLIARPGPGDLAADRDQEQSPTDDAARADEG